jgi:diguanylate cyclase (GGDEF)-like protein
MRLALTDPLTGLGNHRHFHERLQRELLRAEEEGTPLTLCFVDIDDFKKINDRFGHPSGDRVLSQIAAACARAARRSGLGGDEFALLLARPRRSARRSPRRIRSSSDRRPRPRPHRARHRQRRARDVPAAGTRPRRVDPACRQRALLGEEHGKNRVRLYRPDVVELAELKRLGGRAGQGGALPRGRRRSRRPSTHATPIPAATRSA